MRVRANEVPVTGSGKDARNDERKRDASFRCNIIAPYFIAAQETDSGVMFVCFVRSARCATDSIAAPYENVTVDAGEKVVSNVAPSPRIHVEVLDTAHYSGTMAVVYFAFCQCPAVMHLHPAYRTNARPLSWLSRSPIATRNEHYGTNSPTGSGAVGGALGIGNPPALGIGSPCGAVIVGGCMAGTYGAGAGAPCPSL